MSFPRVRVSRSAAGSTEITYLEGTWSDIKAQGTFGIGVNGWVAFQLFYELDQSSLPLPCGSGSPSVHACPIEQECVDANNPIIRRGQSIPRFHCQSRGSFPPTSRFVLKNPIFFVLFFC